MYLYNFLETINKSFDTHIKGYSNQVMEILVNYPWPGNVRQLIHVLEQVAISAWDVSEVSIKHLPKEVLRSGNERSNSGNWLFHAPEGHETIDQGKESIISALEKTRGNKRRAATLLHIARSTLYKRMKQYGIAEAGQPD
jgi:transcriptional regulator with PAS, ATPase and Fis domain